MKRTLALSAATTAAAAIVLVGCSSSTDSSHSGHPSGSSVRSMTAMPSTSTSVQAGDPATGPHNEADVTFASDMIPHHRQAVEMADIALSTSRNAQVLTIAREIKAAQAPEIATMTGWLRGWSEPVPTASGMGGMGGMGHDGHSMPGMMTSGAMDALRKATGTGFDTMFLTMMVEHHTGAVSMARTELAQGRSADARTLATSIVSTQTTEIATMKKLAAGL